MSKNNFEDIIEKIKKDIATLEKDETSLDETIKIYENCQTLIKEASDMLVKAEGKVKKIIEKMGNIEITDLEN